MMAVIDVTYDKKTLAPFLMYSTPITFKEKITLYPVSMEHVMEFQGLSKSITFRKDSRIGDKKILKMTYLEFLFYAIDHPELNLLFEDTPDLSKYLQYLFLLLRLVCPNQEISFYENTGNLVINGCEITHDEFDDIRRIIILQNGINFDIDEFLNYETEMSLKKAEQKMSQGADPVTTEDYIDAMCVALHLSEEEIKNMSIRKFYRIVKRQKLHEDYTIMRTGEMSGMVKFKQPLKYWIRSTDEDDKYAHLKADEGELRSKMG